MSESTFPFGAAADSSALAVEEKAPSSRKPLLAVGGLVGALALGAGAFFLLGGSGADDGLALGVAPPVAPAAAPAEPQAVAVIPAASTESIGRNPFKARYIAPVAAPAPAEAPAAAPAALPLPPPQPVQITVAQQPAPAPAAEPAPAQYPLTLVAMDVSSPERTATWKIDGKDIAVVVNQRFGKYGELVVLGFPVGPDGIQRVKLQVGDAAPFDAETGQTYQVL